jgi:hypothetical protein
LVSEKGKSADAYPKYQAVRVESDGLFLAVFTDFDIQSKTLAERAVWKFLQEHPDAKFDAVTVNPPYLYGPVIHEVSSWSRINASTLKLYKLLSDPLPQDEKDLGTWAGDHLHVS